MALHAPKAAGLNLYEKRKMCYNNLPDYAQADYFCFAAPVCFGDIVHRLICHGLFGEDIHGQKGGA